MRSIPHIPGPHILMTLMLGGHHRMSSNNLTPSFPCPIMSSLSNTGHLISRLSWNQVRGDNKVTSHFEIESDFNLSGHWGSRPARYISVFWCLDDNGPCLPGDWITGTQWGSSLQFTEPAQTATYTNNIAVIETGSSVGNHQNEPFINFSALSCNCTFIYPYHCLLPGTVAQLEAGRFSSSPIFCTAPS